MEHGYYNGQGLLRHFAIVLGGHFRATTENTSDWDIEQPRVESAIVNCDIRASRFCSLYVRGLLGDYGAHAIQLHP